MPRSPPYPAHRTRILYAQGTSLIIPLLLLTILSACGTGITSTKPTGSTSIEIATDFPVSGRDASTGKPIENGAHLAIDDATAEHLIPGYTFHFVPKDDVGPSGLHDPAMGAQNVTALIGDALVAGIIGPYNSSVAQAEMPIANQAPIAIISPANTNQCLTQSSAAVGCDGKNNIIPVVRPRGNVTYFRIATTDDHQGASAIYFYQTFHYRKVVIIDDAETYGVGVANSFSSEWQKLGGTILQRQSAQGTTVSYIPLLTRVAALHPDFIFFGGVDTTGGILIRQQMFQVAGLKNMPLVGAGGLLTDSFAATAGLTGGPVYATMDVPDITKIPAAANFVTKYKATGF
jgi:branched-chain amino acid transport system substrate-binding protein